MKPLAWVVSNRKQSKIDYGLKSLSSLQINTFKIMYSGEDLERFLLSVPCINIITIEKGLVISLICLPIMNSLLNLLLLNKF